MQAWCDKNIKSHCSGIEGYELRIKAAFAQAKSDGVTKLVLTFGLGEETPYGSLLGFSKTIHAMHQEIAPKIELIRTLFDEGVKVTMNTDDMIIFDVSISQMLMNFYNDNVFTAKELDVIRNYSLEWSFLLQQIHNERND